MRHQHQRHLTPENGDCFAACVATILDVDLADTPNFCSLGRDWWQKFQEWLRNRNLGAVAVDLSPGDRAVMWPLPLGVPVILTGPSRRSDGLHSVVGTTHDEGFEYVFDPNPGGGYLSGPPMTVVFFVAVDPQPETLAANRRPW